MGQCYLKNKNTEMAIASNKKALQLDSHNKIAKNAKEITNTNNIFSRLIFSKEFY
ncbi:tetratricopeptide repeat protein [Flavobacterium shii]|uniref:tetratricopeptide repeat protein n=1 Tax=Flavobacterium shii TaxID=2987687 RepID=UPI00384F3F19